MVCPVTSAPSAGTAEASEKSPSPYHCTMPCGVPLPGKCGHHVRAGAVGPLVLQVR